MCVYVYIPTSRCSGSLTCSVSLTIHHYYQERGEQQETKVTGPKLLFGSYLPPLIFTERGDRWCLSFLQSYKGH